MEAPGNLPPQHRQSLSVPRSTPQVTGHPPPTSHPSTPGSEKSPSSSQTLHVTDSGVQGEQERKQYSDACLGCWCPGWLTRLPETAPVRWAQPPAGVQGSAVRAGCLQLLLGPWGGHQPGCGPRVTVGPPSCPAPGPHTRLPAPEELGQSTKHRGSARSGSWPWLATEWVSSGLPLLVSRHPGSQPSAQHWVGDGGT